jgi:hypothetical protein
MGGKQEGVELKVEFNPACGFQYEFVRKIESDSYRTALSLRCVKNLARMPQRQGERPQFRQGMPQSPHRQIGLGT